MAILKLVDDGKIDLDAEVQKYVPYFPKKKHPVTVRQVLGHIGGISHYRNYGEEGFFNDRKNTKQSLAVFQDWDLIAEPGTRYRYSSYGYNLLGAVIEGASGESYGKYMKKNVWGPMSMKTIVMDDPQKLIPNRVRGYAIRDGRLRNSVFVDISSRFAAGGTRASVLDMLRFGQGIIERKVLTDKSFKTMTTSMALNKRSTDVLWSRDQQLSAKRSVRSPTQRCTTRDIDSSIHFSLETDRYCNRFKSGRHGPGEVRSTAFRSIDW